MFDIGKLASHGIQLRKSMPKNRWSFMISKLMSQPSRVAARASMTPMDFFIRKSNLIGQRTSKLLTSKVLLFKCSFSKPPSTPPSISIISIIFVSSLYFSNQKTTVLPRAPTQLSSRSMRGGRHQRQRIAFGGFGLGHCEHAGRGWVAVWSGWSGCFGWFALIGFCWFGLIGFGLVWRDTVGLVGCLWVCWSRLGWFIVGCWLKLGWWMLVGWLVGWLVGVGLVDVGG